MCVVRKKVERVLFFLVGLYGFSLPAQAQITPDRTLGNESTQIIRNLNIRGITSDRIDGGAVRGSNLFHSFQEFNIDLDRGVYFNNPSGISNIFTRVTGSNISNINGTLGVLGDANLFFMNPNGIVFGNGARLDLNGSFFATTGNSIDLGNNINFSARNPQNMPVLRTNFVPGLGFGSQVQVNVDRNSGDIIVRDDGHGFIGSILGNELLQENPNLAGLKVQFEQNLGLIGGRISFDGGILKQPGGYIEIGAVNNGIVKLNRDPSNWNFNYEEVSDYQNINLSNQALVEIDGIDPGSINIRGRNISVLDGSILRNRNNGSRSSGDLNLNASGFIKIKGISPNFVRSEISSATFDRGNPANINIWSQGLEIDEGQILSATTSIVNSGDINIATQKLLIKNAGRILNFTRFGNGNAGDIKIKASQSIQVSGAFPFFVENIDSFTSEEINAARGLVTSLIGSTSFDSGAAGNINISTKNLRLTEGGVIANTTGNNGKNGDLIVNAINTEIIGSLPFGVDYTSAIASFTRGNNPGSSLYLSTETLILKDGGYLGSITFSQGKEGIGGNVFLDASSSISIIGTTPVFIPSVINTQTSGQANAGNLTINTSQLILQGGGRIDAVTLADGNAGKLNINARDYIEVSGQVPGAINPTLITASANVLDENLRNFFNLPDRPTGDAGGLTINTPELRISDGAGVGSFNDGTGNAGEVNLNIDRLTLDNNANISTTSFSGLGGQIRIQGQQTNTPSSLISLNNGSAIETNNSTTNNPEVGTIDIFTRDLHLNNGSTIRATVQDTAENPLDPDLNLVGGNVNIRATGDIRVENNSAIEASVENRPGGNINGGNITINGGGNIFLGNNTVEGTAITASVDRAGNGGNINITLPNGVLVAVNEADIRANAVEGRGGNINISAFAIVTTTDVDIEASSERGIDGTVNLDQISNTDELVFRKVADVQTYETAIKNACLGAGNREGSTIELSTAPPQKDFNPNEGEYRLNLFVSGIKRSIKGKSISEIKMFEPNVAITIKGRTYLGKACLSGR